MPAAGQVDKEEGCGRDWVYVRGRVTTGKDWVRLGLELLGRELR